MKTNFLLATVVAIGFHIVGSASAQSTSTIPEVELIPGTWVCLNNGNPDCKNPPIATQPLKDNSPNAYDISKGKLEPGNWNCINNGNAVCGNPTRFNVVPAKNKN
jgi:hypothetical protein